MVDISTNHTARGGEPPLLHGLHALGGSSVRLDGAEDRRTAERIGVQPNRCVAIEDSSNGLRAGAAAGMAVIAVPNPRYPPDKDALRLAAACVNRTADVTPELIQRLNENSTQS